MRREILPFAAVLAAGALTYNLLSDDAEPAQAPDAIEYGVEDYQVSQPPALEQFTPCETNPEAVYVDFPSDEELRIGNGEWVLSLRHVVGSGDTIDSIAACYFEQPEIGLLSLDAANPDINLGNLQPNDSIQINLSSAMWFNVGTNPNSPRIAGATGLRLPLVEALVEHDSFTEENILLPRQQPCEVGELYYVVHEGDSLDSIAQAVGDVADEVYAHNSIGPEMLRPGQVLRISTRGYLTPDNFTPPTNGFWYQDSQE